MSIDTNNKSTMMVMVVAILALLAIITYAVMHAPDQRTSGEKVGDAVNNVSDGIKNAGRSLENRTPAEKARDAIQDVGTKIKSSAD